MSKELKWIEPFEGFVYSEQTAVVESLEQTRMLEVRGIDPVIFGGKAVTSEVRFTGADGKPAVTARRRTPRPSPGKAGAGGRPPVIEDATQLRTLAGVKMTPERVTDYRVTENRIHFDPDAAKQAGFRAPIIGGGMGVHYQIAEIWRRYSPRSLDLGIYFRRPIFWDDAISVRAAVDGGTWRAICLAKGDKVATQARINHIGR